MPLTYLLRRELPKTWQEWLIFLGILAVIVAVLLYSERRQRLAFERAALELGLSFDPLAINLPYLGLRKLPLLKRSAGLSNALHGNLEGILTVVLDCKVGSGRSAIRQTVACFQSPGRNLPTFEQRPENVVDKIAAAFGSQDFDFDSSPQYSKSYLLRGEDEAAVRSLFHPGVLAFFEQHPGWCVEGKGHWVGVYHRGQSVEPAALREFLTEAREIARVFAA